MQRLHKTQKLYRHFFRPAGLLFFLAIMLVVQPYFYTGPSSANEAQPQKTNSSEEIVLKKAAVALEKGDRVYAADLFVQFFDRYPNSSKAEKSLWSAARIYKQEAEQSKDPDWEKVRDINRKYYTYFPDTKRGQEAYLEVGIANFHMHSLREAQIYFKLFLERYPKSKLLPRTKYWQAKTLFAIGHLAEAEKIYRELVQSNNRDLRRQATVNLGDLYLSAGKHEEALKSYEAAIKETPPDSPEYLEVLRKQGSAYAGMKDQGYVEKGRKLLYQYLNLVETAQEKNMALFDLAESYGREGNDSAAQKLYGKVVESGGPDERVVVLSRFRQAQYLDDPKQKLKKWQKRGDLEDQAGDAPYLAVLKDYADEPIAQDARYGLFLRYMTRKDYDQAFQMGKSYLQSGSAKGRLNGKAPAEAPGDILVLLVENLLQNREFKKVYDIYVTQHDYVNNYKRGRLLFLVGQALENMHLYDQASVVYYRALGLTLTEEEKTDLYYHRAVVYLANRDWKSADRLLRHLREKVFRGKKEIGEVYYLSGRLEEENGSLDKALDYYDRACEILTFPDRKGKYAAAQLRVLLALEKYDDIKDRLGFLYKNKWLRKEEIQEWYDRLGDVFYAKNDSQKAARMYLAVINKGMPEENGPAQNAHLRLGEIYADLGDNEKSAFHYRQAEKGQDPVRQKIAAEKLKQNEIDQVMQKVGTILEN